jgi:spore coat polysaccharide biosynthesis predicted glycosyltransferase SpsG
VAPDRLRRELARATVAVVAGGTTLYEACALGTPVVAVAVVPAQRGTLAAFRRQGLARIPVPGAVPEVGTPAWGAAIAAAAADLWADAAARRMMAAASRTAIDGRGAERVARAIRRLVTATKARTA